MSDYIDWYNDDEVEKLHEKCALQFLKLMKKLYEAKEKGDENAISKAYLALKKHNEKEKVYKRKAKEVNYYWM